ncbi:MAG: hypothetical protein J0H49_31120 [Acidobacteria bacterium]|nr:hypothetical protein [Acidobacteriota bacterium]
MADSVAEELWCKASYSLVETTALTVAIERDWESVTTECPNADPAYRTYVAIRDRSARDTACLRTSQDLEARAWRRSRADLATLHRQLNTSESQRVSSVSRQTVFRERQEPAPLLLEPPADVDGPYVDTPPAWPTRNEEKCKCRRANFAQ